MTDGKHTSLVDCTDRLGKSLHTRHGLFKLLLFGIILLSGLGTIAPATGKAATYVRVSYGRRPYHGHPHVYRGRYYYRGSYWRHRYYRYHRWHYY
jgi:hypothetical protein